MGERKHRERSTLRQNGVAFFTQWTDGGFRVKDQFARGKPKGGI